MPSDSSDESNQSGKEKRDHPRKRKNSGTQQSEDTPHERIEAMEKRFTEQQRWYEEQMEKKDRELEMMNREVEESRNRRDQEEARNQQPPVAATPPMKRGEIPTVVVEINQGNRELVSNEHNGMVMNPDGTLSRTPQYETWIKNKEHQLKGTYDTTPRLPEYLNSTPGHPLPTNLRLIWTHMGDWLLAPEDPAQEGSEFGKFRVARVEPYIDVDGTIRKALSYGRDAESLSPWYNMEDIKPSQSGKYQTLACFLTAEGST